MDDFDRRRHKMLATQVCDDLVVEARQILQASFQQEQELRLEISEAEVQINADWAPILAEFYGEAYFELVVSDGSLSEDATFKLNLHMQKPRVLATGCWEGGDGDRGMWKLEWGRKKSPAHGYRRDLFILLSSFLREDGQKYLLEELLNPKNSRLPKCNMEAIPDQK